MIEMKNSGVDWIGEIPAHWEVKRLKDVAYLYSGLTGKAGDDFTPEQEPGTKPYIPFTNVLNNNEVNPQIVGYVRINEQEQQNKVQENDLIFLMSSEDYESIAKASVVSQKIGEVYLNSFCRGLRPTSKQIYSKFLNYLLSANNCRDALRFEARGFTRINIKIDKIASHIIFYPPIAEQQAIADYLDEKTAEIDEQISLLEQKQKAYVNLKQSLISQVVTRGLNPNAPLKNSGIDWIGEIPAHWEIRRLKDIANFYTGNSLNESEKEIYGENRNPNSLPYIGTKDVERNKSQINYNSGYSIPNDDTSFAIAPKGATLICVEGGSAGKKIGFLEQDVCFVNKLCCAKSLIDNDKFVYYYFNTNLFVNQFNRLLQGMIGGVSINKIKCMLFFVPPIEEQQAIADYLDEKTAEIDEQISNIDKKINTYKRLKQSLIDEVVTGKRKI